ncbi:hypothetical protein BCR42DRAFT_417352 [Absidia repens]|uniref:Uncharacterized protein n=1 Tax=Absidia repens TaxID=90262 RepID=A0A1X2IF73_9FUNG|nr:hypothetical protein BCR42DRAFT_417352 [Absidia repens]
MIFLPLNILIPSPLFHSVHFYFYFTSIYIYIYIFIFLHTTIFTLKPNFFPYQYASLYLL